MYKAVVLFIGCDVQLSSGGVVLLGELKGGKWCYLSLGSPLYNRYYQQVAPPEEVCEITRKYTEIYGNNASKKVYRLAKEAVHFYKHHYHLKV